MLAVSTVLRYVEVPMVWGSVWAEESGLGPPYNLTVHLVLLGGFYRGLCSFFCTREDFKLDQFGFT